MEIGYKFKHSKLQGYFFEITAFTEKGYKGIETRKNGKNKPKKVCACYPKKYFEEPYCKENGWIKL